MPRKIVFAGACMPGDLSEQDQAVLELALRALGGLADRGLIEFRRGAGRTVGIGRQPENVLTPIALDILRHATDSGPFGLAGLREATGLNKNSLTANLFKLAEAGYLERTAVDRNDGQAPYGHTKVWRYDITAKGREAAPPEDEASGPAFR